MIISKLKVSICIPFKKVPCSSYSAPSSLEVVLIEAVKPPNETVEKLYF